MKHNYLNNTELNEAKKKYFSAVRASGFSYKTERHRLSKRFTKNPQIALEGNFNPNQGKFEPIQPIQQHQQIKSEQFVQYEQKEENEQPEQEIEQNEEEQVEEQIEEQIEQKQPEIYQKEKLYTARTFVQDPQKQINMFNHIFRYWNNVESELKPRQSIKVNYPKLKRCQKINLLGLIDPRTHQVCSKKNSTINY